MQRIEYSCKTLPFGTLASVMIAMNVGLIFVFATAYTTLNPIISTILMVSAMALVLYILSSETVFYIDGSGLSRKVLSKNFALQFQKDKYYQWSDVQSFKNGTDKGKYRGEFQFLEINFKNGDSWKLTDMYGERIVAYNQFLTTFLSIVNVQNESRKMQPTTKVTASAIPTTLEATELIQRKKTFYETIYAKLFTIAIGVFLFIILTKGIAYLNNSSIFKIGLVIVPGFLYLAYRSFIKNTK